MPAAEPDFKHERDHAMGVRFDPTVNLGHALSALAMAGALVTTYISLDKRVVVLEEKSAATASRAAEQQSETKEVIREIRSDIKEVQRSLNDINRAVSSSPRR